MSSIFVSYRRADGDYAVLVYAWLTEHFGSKEVFWDREDIDPGKNFRDVLSKQLESCQALVALIGPGWSPSEWIRNEIEAALRRDVLVLPVLLGGRDNLQEKDLPPTLGKLAALQSLETRDLRFRARFVEALERVSSRSPSPVGETDLRAQRLADLLQDQAARRQREALELLVAGEAQRALEVLEQAFDLLMALLEFRPGNPEIEVRLGFLYKDLAQAFLGTDKTRAQRYLEQGLRVLEATVQRKLTPDLQVSAWNCFGNLYLMLGDFDRAIEWCQRAVDALPTYSYAWGDLFNAYEGRARHGNVDVAAMRHALARLKETGAGDDLLESQFTRYERELAKWEQPARRR